MTTSSPQVIELLEAYLETAKEHEFNHIAIAMTGYPNIAALDFAGDVALECGTREAVGLLTSRLEASIDDWTLPPRDESLDASHVVYNVANGPLGYDFIVWLVDAEMTRIREQAPAPLKVAFWLGKTGNANECRLHWLNNLFRPALELIGAVESHQALRGRNKPIFVPRDIIAAAKLGEPVPVLQGYDDLWGRGCITITLREASYDSGRNSNHTDWLRFARYLRDRGEVPIIVRDTAKADEPFEDFITAPKASRNLLDRAALYQSARANLFVSNGPSSIAVFGDRPCLLFTRGQDGYGLSHGEQFPWSRANQRIVWAPDTYDNIVSAWENLNL